MQTCITEQLENGPASTARPAFPADQPPDILNHWTVGLTDKQILEALERSGHFFHREPSDPFASPTSAETKQMQDKVKREVNRAVKRECFARHGSQNGRSVLDEIDVCFIRSMHKVWGLSIAEIARRRKLPSTTVRDIIRRKTWTHI